jgi:hypothetical protein
MDELGLITRNLKNPSEIVRVTSGGVFLSNDGGVTWTTGITGNGINAKTITTGQLNTALITIMNGNNPAFRWDATGLVAIRRDGGSVIFNEDGIKGKGTNFEYTLSQDGLVFEKDKESFFKADSEGVEVKGIIKATGGDIGGCYFENGTLQVPAASV